MLEKNILVFPTGGTIMCKQENGVSAPCLSVLDCIAPKGVAFDINSTLPQILSEHITPNYISSLIKKIEKSIKQGYRKIVVTHGSDTLFLTASILGFCFCKYPIQIVLVASNTMPSSTSSEASKNMQTAFGLDYKNHGVFVVYESTKKFEFSGLDFSFSYAPLDENVLFIKTFGGMNYSFFNTSNASGMVVELFHSGTGSRRLLEFLENSTAPAMIFPATDKNYWGMLELYNCKNVLLCPDTCHNVALAKAMFAFDKNFPAEKRAEFFAKPAGFVVQ